MNPALYIFLSANFADTESFDTHVSWVFHDINNALKLVSGKLSDVASDINNHHVTVVLQGETVTSLKAEVPGKNLQRVLQAVPYVLEDQVIDDVESLYFAVNKNKENADSNEYDVAVINKEYLEGVIKQLENAGIYADAMIADYMLLDEDTLLFDGTRVLCNSPGTRFSTSMNIAPDLLDVGIFKLVTCANEEQNTGFSDLFPGFELQQTRCSEVVEICLLENRNTNNAINLLQGVYKKKKDWSQAGKTWYPVAALFLVWIIVQGGLFIYDYINLSKQNESLNTQIVKIYKQTFPDARRVVDARAQMEQKLSGLKRRQGQSGRSFSEMLASSAAVFAKTRGLVIKTLRYYDGRINIEMQVASLQALDSLKELLQKEKGYQVEIQNASSGKESVTARLQIVSTE